MDNRLKILYRRSLFERRSDTERNARVRLEEHVQAGRLCGRQIRHTQSREVMGAIGDNGEGAGTRLSRKASSEDSGARTETDTGRQEENSKVRGKTLVKELGKMYP